MFSFVKKVLVLAVALVGMVNAAPFEKRDNVGDATYYNAGLGACGIWNSDADYIVAVSAQYFDTFPGYASGDPNSNPLCGRYLQANYQGRSVTVRITDRCVGCAYGDIDLTPAAFQQLADQSVGRLHGVTWNLL
ncbi:RlpA-like double-psi beta-barrel-protein domain-containing protein-containing protein [Cyathus striatus]|nr:RlpA-like double-psi beta-barrel-protein domain-containing protein-containing protein [Cyathus striatus]